MPRGGYREKAGRPSTWKSGCKFQETKLIRVPAKIADQVLEIAHNIDATGSLDFVTKNRTVSLGQVKAISRLILLDDKITRNGKDRGRVRHALETLVSRLCDEEFEIETKSETKARQGFLVKNSDQVNLLPVGSERSGEG